MTSIESILEEDWFYAKPWLVVGTAPSIEGWKDEYKDKFNVWTINAAIDVTGWADIAALHDANIYSGANDILKNNELNCRHVLTRTTQSLSDVSRVFNHGNPLFIRLKEQAGLWEDPGDLKTYKSHNSTGVAFYFLSKYGKRKVIYTLGIGDDTEKVSPLITEFYRNGHRGVDWALHNLAIDIYQKIYGYDVIKL